MDNMALELEADDVLVAEHLTRHKRIVTIKHEQDAERDVGDTEPKPRDNDAPGRSRGRIRTLRCSLKTC
ncbi:DUF2577 domain-containing protein [Brevibacillus sp. WF146]|nr:DUF2577 domain-containing protein [Brevibacillus sp. WF146]